MKQMLLIALVTVVSLVCLAASGVAGKIKLKGEVYSPEAGTRAFI